MMEASRVRHLQRTELMWKDKRADAPTVVGLLVLLSRYSWD